MSVELLKALSKIEEENHYLLEGLSDAALDIIIKDVPGFNHFVKLNKDYLLPYSENEAVLKDLLHARILQTYNDAALDTSL